MNCSSFWKRLQASLSLGSLALSLGLPLAIAGTAHAQLPQTLPPYNPNPQMLPATPAMYIQDGKDAPREAPTETPKAAPAPLPAPIMETAPAACETCGPGKSRHGIFGHNLGHGLGYGGGGCSSGGCSSGGCSSGGCSSGGCRSCVKDSCGPQPCYGCGYGGCFPGHQNCCPIDEGCGPLGRFWACFYHCLCCPDPCYEPRYIVAANSAFWVDGARPVTMTRFRWDSVHNFRQFDRSEFYRQKFNGVGSFANRVNYNALMFYQEAATKKASFFIEQDYRSISPDIGPSTSGFGDMNLGTKALLFDCELMQLTFQFKTYLPVGNGIKGLGTQHVSLEPSLLTSVKLAPETYFQGQIAQWIPIAADPAFGGSVLHYHAAVNHVLYRCQPDIPFIGSLEVNGYSFQDGLYSTVVNNQIVGVTSSGDTWWTYGPSLRMSICNKLDLGFSAVFGLGQGGPDQLYRSEVRLRF